MPLIATRGAASAQGFGEFAQTTAPVYIEDVFSTYLYTGNSTNRSITNDIDLSSKGGLVWIKDRNAGFNHTLFDTSRGATKYLSSDNTNAEGSASNTLTAFNSNGFNLGTNAAYTNGSGITYASWTFREQAKFFDIVTYTGNGATNRAISHNLGSTPGCIMIKCTSSGLNTASWSVWHQDIGTNQFLTLNTTAAAATDNTQFGGSPTSTTFTVAGGGAQIRTNQSGETYVAYLFAHNAGGFGLTGSDNVISCGSFTTDGSGNATVSLGYEPQWMITKASTQAENWYINDVMRGYYAPSQGAISGLSANTSNAESGTRAQYINATGFTVVGGLSAFQTYIYIAIRRGPMKTPTTGTSVFAPVAVSSATSTGTQISNSFVVDAAIAAWQDGTAERGVNDRLRGISTTNPTGSGNPFLRTNTTGAETTPSNVIYQGDGKAAMLGRYFAGQGYNQIYWLWGRAPGFFDVVCYTGTGSTPGSFNHNLGVVPEMVIVKSRSLSTEDWRVWAVTYSGGALSLNSNAAKTIGGFGGAGTIPATSSVFYVSPSSTPNNMNSSGATYVAYLFATVAGVSKVGSYTGTGGLQTVNCGFTTGARFVLIKRTDSTGDWWVYDSARGISSGNDPYLFLNSTAAEVTNTNYVDTTSVGFQVTAAAPAGLNANGGNFIFLAVA